MYDVVPSNLVMKRVSPRWWLAGLTTVWGVIAMSLGFVRNYVSRRFFFFFFTQSPPLSLFLLVSWYLAVLTVMQ
jgi:hypothetical protein